MSHDSTSDGIRTGIRTEDVQPASDFSFGAVSVGDVSVGDVSVGDVSFGAVSFGAVYGRLCWEYSRLCRRPALLILVVGWLLGALYWEALEPLGARRPALVFISLSVSALLMQVLTLLQARDGGMDLGFESRLFRLPISSLHLALGRLLPACLTIALLQLALALFMRLLYAPGWPILGPTLLAVATLAWALALLWALGSWPLLLPPAVLALMALLGAWLKPRFQADTWWHASPAEIATLLAATTLAAGVAILGVARARSRDPRAHTLEAWLAARVPSTRSVRGHRSDVQAQLWMEWRQKGRVLPLFVVVGFATQLGFSSLPTPDTGRALAAVLGFALFVLLVAPVIIGFLHGRFDLSSHQAGIDRFRALRPWSDRRLAWALLAASLRTLTVTWLVTVLSLSAALLGIFLVGEPSGLIALFDQMRALAGSISVLDLGLLLAGLALAAWTALGLVLGITLTGSNLLTGGLIVAPTLGLALLFVLDRNFELEVWSRVLPIAIPTAALAMPLVSALSCLQAWRRGYLSAIAATLLLALPLIAATLVTLRLPLLRGALEAGGLAQTDSALALLLPASLFCPVLPLALAPLALALNRHR